MNKKKIVLITLIIIDIIIFTVAIYLTVKLIKTNENTTKNTIENKIENAVINNVIENEIKENIIENNVIENVIDHADIHNTEPISDPEQEIDKNTMYKQQTDQEKAINIAKENWGEDNTVEFTFDHVDENGRYVVFVRDIETTRQIDEYVIDIQTEKVVQ